MEFGNPKPSGLATLMGLDPAVGRVLFARALAEQGAGALTDARQTLDALLLLYPTSTAVHRLAARCCQARHDAAGAAQHDQMATALENQDAC